METAAEPELDAPPGAREISSSPTTAVAAQIETIRATVHHWIDEIEHRLSDFLRASFADHEEKLAQTRSELDHDRQALVAEIERREHEWEGMLQALEHDRRLLADAWERLESEQLAVVGSSRAAAHSMTVEAAPPARPEPPRIQPETETAAARAVLRQFEALRHDVRTQAGARRNV